MTEASRLLRSNDEAGRQCALDRLHVLDTQPEPAFEKITRLVATVIGVPVAAVTLIDRNRQWFKSIRGLDLSETPREIAFCDHTIRGAHCLNVQDATRDPRFSNNPFVKGPPHVRAYLGAPIITRDGYALGAICAIDYKTREFSQEQETVLASFADLVMNELELRQVASSDGLTGLATRRTFVGAVGDVFINNSEGGLISIDLDFFKAINDSYGHPVGDEALKAAAAAILEICPRGAVAGRLGGEELGLVLPEVDEAATLEVAEALRSAVASARVEGYPDLRVTASIGVAMRSNHSRWEDWMAASDAALYEAKSAGRNCVRATEAVLAMS